MLRQPFLFICASPQLSWSCDSSRSRVAAWYLRSTYWSSISWHKGYQRIQDKEKNTHFKLLGPLGESSETNSWSVIHTICYSSSCYLWPPLMRLMEQVEAQQVLTLIWQIGKQTVTSRPSHSGWQQFDPWPSSRHVIDRFCYSLSDTVKHIEQSGPLAWQR